MARVRLLVQKMASVVGQEGYLCMPVDSFLFPHDLDPQKNFELSADTEQISASLVK